ncbi:hypothetical protein ACFPME_14520 [Rhodanobacter umsongensis]|uniref:CopL family metal-binding regulatory protein n=1 Tax=Rhodanobacter umsongensis TaxID=633153 RepID=A0ABW0JNW3_9GAMM
MQPLFLRVMAALAWLILVATPVHGSPRAAMGVMPRCDHAVFAAHAIVHDDHPAAAAGADVCCDKHDAGGRVPHEACPCTSPCASALPAASITGLIRVAPEAPLAAPRRIDAPRGVHAPLLRPPAA